MTKPSILNLPPLLSRLRPFLAERNQPAYLVGGAVRDAIMGKAGHDIDLVVADDALAVTFQLANALGYPAYVLDAERAVGRIVIPGEMTTLDIAAFRGRTLEDDLRGRDFTINAMALPAGALTPDQLIDRHHGLDDLRTGLIRAIEADSIAADPVRALRVARFAAQLDFAVVEDTAAAARAALPDLLVRTSTERMRDELTKLLSTHAPHRGVALLNEMGLLEGVLPEVAALADVAQSPPHHEAVLPHTLSVLRYLVDIERLLAGDTPPTDWARAIAEIVEPYRDRLLAHLERGVDGSVNGRALLRWGALYHDVGKRETQSVDESGRIRFFGHEEVGAAQVAARLSRLSFGNAAIRHTRTIVAGHMRPLHLAAEKRSPSRRAIYRYFRDLHEAGIDVCLLTMADHFAAHEGVSDEESRAWLLAVVAELLSAYYDTPEESVTPVRLLNGRDVIALLDRPAGHEIGRLLTLLEEAQAAGEITTREAALEFVRRHAQS